LLNSVVPGGFHHVVQSVRVVEVLEKEGRGLNLTAEVKDGILRHSKGKGNVLLTGAGDKALTLEAEVVRIADIVAYVNHDLDDALRAGLFGEGDLPSDIRRVLGNARSQRFATLVHDVMHHTDLDGGDHVEMSQEVHEALLALRDFLYARVYENPVVREEFHKAQRILRDLYEWCLEDPARFFVRSGVPLRDGENVERAATDWLSGMTDRFALATWEELFVPRPWSLL
jgi:dGTPase